MIQRWHIGEVAAFFGVRSSTLRYWEGQGLLRPSGRRSGRRVYDREDPRRIALVMTWRDTGLMELRDIEVMLDGGREDRGWREIVTARMAAIDRHRQRLDTAHAYLAHLATCPSDHPAATCPYLAQEIDRFLGERGGPLPHPRA